ncbi:MAG: ABC transporter substrate-binding protein [Symploca sp. SIO2B6]|nr:ABC transporter substrate-binding protein [Symploca sp. SIO2B6]
MRLRNFFNQIAIGGLGAAGLAACSNPSQTSDSQVAETEFSSKQPFIQWKMPTSWPKEAEMLYGSAAKLCQRISEMTDGRFSITPYEAGELVEGLDILDALQTGKAECGHTTSNYYFDKSPALAFATSVPFGLTARQQYAWLYSGGGLELIQDIHQDLGVMYFPAATVGANMGGWFRKEINSVEDLKGLKMRIPGMGAKVIARLGVEPKVLSADAIFTAMETGELDAVEWSVPYNDEKLGLNRVASHYYYPSWWEPGVVIDVLISLDAWNQLPMSYQVAFKTAATEIALTSMSEFITLNSDAIERIKRYGTKILPMSEEILDAAYKEAFDLYDELSAQDETFKKVYEHWREFRNKVYRWDLINEISYANYTFNSI